MNQPADEHAGAKWSRVFSLRPADDVPERLRPIAASLQPGPHFSCETGPRGWERITLTWGPGDLLVIERFWRDEEGIRGELLAWAAWLETIPANPHAERLMAHMIQTQEVLTLRSETRSEFAKLITGQLALTLDSVYQVDEEGLFDANGSLLVKSDS